MEVVMGRVHITCHQLFLLPNTKEESRARTVVLAAENTRTEKIDRAVAKTTTHTNAQTSQHRTAQHKHKQDRGYLKYRKHSRCQHDTLGMPSCSPMRKSMQMRVSSGSLALPTVVMAMLILSLSSTSDTRRKCLRAFTAHTHTHTHTVTYVYAHSLLCHWYIRASTLCK